MSHAAPGVSAVAERLLCRLDALTDDIVALIRARIPFYVESDQVPGEALRASVRDNVRMILSSFAAEEPPDIASAYASGRERAAQGAPLPEVLGAFRVGFAALWRELVTEARATGAVDDRTLVDVAAEVWRLAGEFSDAMTSAYRDAVVERALRREHERSVLVEALLTGAVDEPGALWETAGALRFPLEGRFAVVAAQTPAPGREALPGIRLRLDAGGVRSAWRLLPDQQVGVLLLPQGTPVGTVLDLLRQQPAARTGVSPVYGHLRETPKALRFARLALGRLPPGEPGAAQFDDTPLAVLLAAAPTETGRIARRVLGPVLELPAADRGTLLDTLECWFDASGSADRTGERLYCHPNTVRYRLRRIERLTGRSLRDPRTVAEFSAALQALRMSPDGV